MFDTILCIVLDGVGVGEAPDAAEYGDTGSDSLGNTARHVGALRLPTLERLGLGNIANIDGVRPVDTPGACTGRLTPASAGKDSTIGHWELMGCQVERPFATFPDGFPPDIVSAFESATEVRLLGNIAVSGTQIIAQLGSLHLQSGRPIVYTSQDSVFQIAAHKDVIAVDDLYAMCRAARTILDEHNVARVIARPFEGNEGGFYRTSERRDFSIEPPGVTVLDSLEASGRKVLTIGKIDDLFAGRGITRAVHTRDNREGMKATLDALRDDWSFIFTNLVDFDTMWGHRNDARAYALGVEEFDSYLVDLLGALDERTLLILTSDHGNDPTTASTDHSREYVPLIACCRGMSAGVDLGTRQTLSDVGRTIADNFEIEGSFPGESFLSVIEGVRK